jgi:hypothetical protein
MVEAVAVVADMVEVDAAVVDTVVVEVSFINLSLPCSIADGTNKGRY